MDPLKIIFERISTMAKQAVELSPQILLAVMLLVVTWLIARLVVFVFRRAMRRSSLRRSLIVVLQKLIAVTIWTIGLLIAATIIFPNLTPANLVAGLGLGSIAVGFAFKDIFKNFLAGVLILLREPMRIGDFIECNGVEGRVEEITLRDTYIRQVDGQLVLVPNAMLFQNAVYVLTDKPIRRITVMCGVAYDEDIDEARDVIKSAVENVKSVNTSQPVEIFAQAFGSSSIDFEVTWWTESKPIDMRESRDEVVAVVKRALDDAGIEIPFPYRTLTFKEPLSLSKSEQMKDSEPAETG